MISNIASGECVTFDANGDFYWTNGCRLGAKVTGWENAEPGTKYSTIITYTATVGDAIN